MARTVRGTLSGTFYHPYSVRQATKETSSMMETVPSGTILHGRYRIESVLGRLLAICDAVIFLHNQQPPIIHRDIKPDNIRITSEGTAILVDLGNAKSAADGVRTLFFIRHQGTPGYAPPEQYPGGAGTDL